MWFRWLLHLVLQRALTMTYTTIEISQKQNSLNLLTFKNLFAHWRGIDYSFVSRCVILVSERWEILIAQISLYQTCLKYFPGFHYFRAHNSDQVRIRCLVITHELLGRILCESFHSYGPIYGSYTVKCLWLPLCLQHQKIL